MSDGHARHICLALAFVLLGSVAWAHDGADTLSAWYRSLITKDGGSCCNTHDCYPTDARIVGDHWEIRNGDTWEAVPPEMVLKRENMEGRAVACRYGGQLRCFVPPVEM